MPIKAKLFYLQRDKDISGVSGVGNVADGVEFANGMCALSFHSEYPHCNVYANMRALLEVHGHEGATKIVFVALDPPAVLRAIVLNEEPLEEAYTDPSPDWR